MAAYPLPLTPHHCWWSWLSGSEHRFLVGFVEQLNDVVEAEAREHGFTYMGAIETAFVGPGLRICDPGDSGDLGVNFMALNPVSGDLSDIALPKHWIHNSFHPNEVGHERLAEIIGATITSGQPRPEHVARVTPIAGSSNQKPGEWTLHQIRSLVLKLLGVLSVGLFGAWLLLLPVFRWTRSNQLSLGRPQDLAAGQISAAQEVLGHLASPNKDLTPYSWYRLGGSAALFASCSSRRELEAIARAIEVTEVPIFVIGRGRTS